MKHIKLFLAALVIMAVANNTFGQDAFENSLSKPSQEIGQIYLDMPLVTLPARPPTRTMVLFFSSLSDWIV